MENTLSIVTTDTPKQKTRKTDPKVWRERALTEEELFEGTDEVGRSGWFLRVSLTGMYPRRIGPYPSKEKALEVLEGIVAEFALDTMIDIQNAMERDQECVVEGVPRLAATVSER
jgi:hypothetical protein